MIFSLLPPSLPTLSFLPSSLSLFFNQGNNDKFIETFKKINTTSDCESLTEFGITTNRYIFTLTFTWTNRGLVRDWVIKEVQIFGLQVAYLVCGLQMFHWKGVKICSPKISVELMSESDSYLLTQWRTQIVTFNSSVPEHKSKHTFINFRSFRIYVVSGLGLRGVTYKKHLPISLKPAGKGSSSVTETTENIWLINRC